MLAAFVLGEVWQLNFYEAGLCGSSILGGIYIANCVGKKQKRGKEAELVFILLFFGFGFLRMGMAAGETEADYWVETKQTVTVEGTLYQVNQTSYAWQYYLKDVTIQNETGDAVTGKTVMVSVKEEQPVRLGNQLWAEDILLCESRARNPGEFDWYLYDRALGIEYRMKPDRVTVTDTETDRLGVALYHLKEGIKSIYRSICTEKDYGIFCAVLLGEKGELDADTRSLYQENGISHILAISGLHISMIGMAVYGLVRKKAGFFVSQLAAGGFMFFYVFMTGAGVSSVRAYVMFLFLLEAATLGRTYDVAVAAGWAALGLLIENPWRLFYAGFLLSFGAILGIGVLGKLLQEYIGSRNFLLKSMVASMSVIWITLPVMAYFFFTYAPYSLLLNLIVVPCMTFLMISALTGMAAGAVLQPAGMIGIGLGHFILVFYEYLCRFTTELPGSQILIGRPSLWQLLLYYGVVAALTIFASQDKQKEKCIKGRIALLSIASVLLLLVLCIKPAGKLQVTFLDVSQGDGIFLKFPSGTTCLIDGGSSDISKVGKYRILPYLQSQRISCIDYAFVSHADSDHISGLQELLLSSDIEVKTLCLTNMKDEAGRKLQTLAEAAGTDVQYLKAGDALTVGEVTLRCLHPAAKIIGTDRNASSMVLWLQYRSLDILFTGDIAEEQEQALLETLPANCDILKSPHHGSRYSNSAAFIEALAPDYVIISCGIDNSYGHPHTEAIDRIQKAGAVPFITTQTGAITLMSDGETLYFQRYLTAEREKVSLTKRK